MSAEIERLEAELADLRERGRQAIKAEADAVHQLEAELADLRASSVVVRERCQTCGGGKWSYIEYEQPECPDCVDGWRLAEGVKRLESNEWHREAAYLIPARLIEGEE